MLKRLFTSNARIKLLSLFLMNQDSEYFVRELTRLLDEQINSVRRELENLKKLGLLKTRSKNRKKFYYVNKNFKLLNELELIFKKSLTPNAQVGRKISQCGNVDYVALTGVFVDEPSKVPIDLLIAGEVDREKLEHFLQKELRFEQPVRYSVIKKDDFIYRWKFKDKFIHDIVNSPETVIAVNKIQKELGTTEN